MNNLVDLAQTPDSLGLEDLAKCYTKHRHHNVGIYHAVLILLYYSTQNYDSLSYHNDWLSFE